MNTPSPVSPSRAQGRRGPSRLKLLFWLVIVPLVLAAAYFFVVLKWNYSSGERAGWVQKFSRKGWLCKTWEGEMAMVTMPGSTPEKFLFTVWDDRVADQINRVMGKRVTVHYEEKVGLPTTCFGETRHFVIGVAAVDEIPLAPGIVVPAPATPVPSPAPTTAAQPSAAPPTPAPSAAPAPAPTPAPAASAPTK
ncbi:MAG TPA: hypothetical protein VMK32_06105 [Burkholderiaceae bacterium]|nr:hypothetical protein [Burkholderiaceae bacterium]